MEEEYDVIILGTGLKECILSGLLSVSGKRVLHMDRNNYYGGTSASLNLKQLHEKFGAGEPPATLGSSRDYNVDLIPKFIMANGILTKLLVHTKVTRYMNYKVIDGSFVYLGGSKGFFSDTAGQIHKVPSNASEAVSSTFMGMFEKNRARQFFTFCQNYDLNDQKTWQKFDVKRQSMQDLFTKFGLEDKTQDFIGHSMALWRDETYRTKPAFDTMERMKLYADSMSRFGKSPYIYPLYGLGELPQGFARLSAIYGGTYMLDKPFLGAEMGGDGKVVGVKSTPNEGDGEAVARAPIVIAAPEYFPEKVEEQGKVVRTICILQGPAPNTNGSQSCQIIVPGTQLGRTNDVYVTVLDASHEVVPAGKMLGMVSTTVETAEPEKEVIPGLDLLGGRDGNILFRFTEVVPYLVPKAGAGDDGIFLTQSYDATSHFETACLDVLAVYQQATGEALDLDSMAIESADDE
jgi:Rab GDP dissociation inhibitor